MDITCNPFLSKLIFFVIVMLVSSLVLFGTLLLHRRTGIKIPIISKFVLSHTPKKPVKMKNAKVTYCQIIAVNIFFAVALLADWITKEAGVNISDKFIFILLLSVSILANVIFYSIRRKKADYTREEKSTQVTLFSLSVLINFVAIFFSSLVDLKFFFDLSFATLGASVGFQFVLRILKNRKLE